ncbi:MAG: polyprenyl synthetase family protein [Actinomycetota bacterium]
MDSPPAYPDDIREKVDGALERFFPPEDTYPDILYRAMRYSLFAGGKRFRPVLTVLTGSVFGAVAEDVMPTACAIEYIHTYSLIHDDLPAIDDDDLRRGRPTCHKAFGEDIAIMAGDALFAEAFALITRLQKASEQGKIIRVISEIAEASGPGGMVGGQVVDMISTGQKIDMETLLYIHANKTGRLIRTAAVCGAVLADANETEVKAVGLYGEQLGLAFQITDDVLDETGSVEALGKTPGQDRAHEKATYTSIAGLDGAVERARSEAAAAVEGLRDIAVDTSALKDLASFVVERTG